MSLPHTEDAETEHVPGTFRAVGAIAWRLVGIGLAAWGIIHMIELTAEIIVPLAVGLLITALLAPLVRLSRRRMGGSSYLHAAIWLLLVLGAITGVLFFVGNQFSSGFSALRDATVAGLSQLEQWVSQISAGRFDGAFPDVLAQAREWLGNNTSGVAGYAIALGGNAAAVLVGALLAIVTALFFLADGSGIWRWVVNLFPRHARATVRRSAHAAWFTMESYARTQVVVAAVDAVGIGIGAWILGVPLVVPIMALVFLSAFIPIIGATLSGALAVLLALVTNGWTSGLIMLAIVLGVMQIESHVLQPLLMGKAVNVHPWAVIIGVAVGALLMGVAGALFAVPIMAMVNAGWQAARGVPGPPATPPIPAAVNDAQA